VRKGDRIALYPIYLQDSTGGGRVKQINALARLDGEVCPTLPPTACTPRNKAMFQNVTVGQRVQKILRIFKNLKHYCRIHKIPPLTPQPQPGE
jgi:hypothetical protein